MTSRVWINQCTHYLCGIIFVPHLCLHCSKCSLGSLVPLNLFINSKSMARHNLTFLHVLTRSQLHNFFLCVTHQCAKVPLVNVSIVLTLLDSNTRSSICSGKVSTLSIPSNFGGSCNFDPIQHTDLEIRVHLHEDT